MSPSHQQVQRRSPLFRAAGGALFLGLSITLGVILHTEEAFADPHAVFFTDAGQRQLFFNVLAALNQADYVEEPGIPAVRADPLPNITEFDGAPDVDAVLFPRIRVRAVTPDDGDVYYRLRVEELKRAAKVRADLTRQGCNFWRWARPAEWDAHPECRGSGPGPAVAVGPVVAVGPAVNVGPAVAVGPVPVGLAGAVGPAVSAGPAEGPAVAAGPGAGPITPGPGPGEGPGVAEGPGPGPIILPGAGPVVGPVVAAGPAVGVGPNVGPVIPGPVGPI